MANPPVSSPQQSGFSPNLLTNPGFEVWQRGNGPFAASAAFTADRWQCYPGGGSVSVAPDTANVDALSATDAAVTGSGALSSSSAALLIQGIEGGPKLIGSTVTLVLRVKASVASAVQATLRPAVGGTVSPLLGTFHPGDGAYHTLTVSGVVPASMTSLAVGLQMVSPCTAYVDNAVLVVGSQPVPYVPLHPADDLHRCQRYYELLGEAGSGNLILYGYSSAANNVYQTFTYKATKPVAPTVTVVGTWGGINNNGNPSVVRNNQTACMLTFLTAAAGLAYVNNSGAGNQITVEANP